MATCCRRCEDAVLDSVDFTPPDVELVLLRRGVAPTAREVPVSEDEAVAKSELADGLGLAPRDRREQIRLRVADEGFVRIEALAEAFGVSLMTIHRDLDELQTQGWLRKVRGGATAQPSSLYHGDVRHRAQTMVKAKEELARCAVELVEPGQSIMIDESTTGLAVARLLPSRAPLTVITNFLAIINEPFPVAAAWQVGEDTPTVARSPEIFGLGGLGTRRVFS